MENLVDRLRSMQGMGDIQLKALMDGVGPQAADEIMRLKKLLSDAAECIEEWGSYASPYFQAKHDLAGDITRFKSASV